MSPTEHPFGSLYIGCEGEQPIEIENIGNADLIVDGFDTYGFHGLKLNSSEGEAVFGDLPWTLAPAEVATVPSLKSMTNTKTTPIIRGLQRSVHTWVMATQQGTGELYGTNADLYEQLKGMTDILFAVDRSCSMDDDIESVQANFGVFTTTMASLDADYHVAATVEDSG